MQDKAEELIRQVYKNYKAQHNQVEGAHPDEELMACFLEGRLSAGENQNIEAHLITCQDCLEKITLYLSAKTTAEKEVPAFLTQQLKDLILPQQEVSFLEIILKVKEKILEVLSTSGDVLFGQEFVPAPLLRSRNIKDFPDEVTILKDFQDIRLEAKVEHKQGEAFKLTVTIKEKATQKIIKDLRITLIREGLELESYLTDSGKAVFEHILLGRYTVEITAVDNKVASILLEIKV